MVNYFRYYFYYIYILYNIESVTDVTNRNSIKPKVAVEVNNFLVKVHGFIYLFNFIYYASILDLFIIDVLTRIWYP